MHSAPRERITAGRRSGPRPAAGVVLLTPAVAFAILGIVLVSNGCSSSGTKPTPPPGRIQDLQAEPMGSAGVMLRWSAPRAASGGAARYDVRVAAAAIADSNWASADTVSGEPVPSAPGATDSFLVGGLDAERIYHFAIRSEDPEARVSPISNDASVETVYGAPKTIATALSNFQKAWNGCDDAEYARIFIPGFVFVFAPQDVGGPGNVPAYWGLADELASVHHLFSRTDPNNVGYIADRIMLQFQAGDETPDGPEGWMKVVLSNVFLTVECHHMSTGDPLSYLVEGDMEWLWFVQEGGYWYIARWEDKPITGLVNPTTFGSIKGRWW